MTEQVITKILDKSVESLNASITYEQVAKDFCAALLSEYSNSLKTKESLISCGFNLADEFFIQLKERQK